MESVRQITPALREQLKLGVEQLLEGKWREAEATYRLILAESKDVPDAQGNLAVALKNQGRLDEAIAACKRALVLQPMAPEIWNNLGDVLRMAKRPEGAIESFRRAVSLRPDLTVAWMNLGDQCRDLRRLPEAIEAYRKVAELKPVLAPIWNNLGTALRQTYCQTEAIAALRRAVDLRPDYALAWNNLAGAYKDVGELDEALMCYDRGLKLEPANAAAGSSRLGLFHYHPGYDAATIMREARHWNQRFAAGFASDIPRHENDRDPQRRLRIGYVSPDFHRHCAAMFIMPLLANHDRGQFDIFCYSNIDFSDAVTSRLKRYGDSWYEIQNLSDGDAAQQILHDKIDILVDLALHTRGNRLQLFARKPAPIQVTWLGYPGTTGMETVDYRLTDARLDSSGTYEPEIRNPKSEIRINDPNPNDQISSGGPSAPQSLPHSDIGKLTSASSVEPGFDSDFGFRASDFKDRTSDFATKEPHYSELSLRLPDSFWCYDPYGMEETDDATLPARRPLPATSAGHFTFGCLNNFSKVSDARLELWRQILTALPNAHLLMLAPAGEARERVLRKLGLMDPQRVEFVLFQPRTQYLETYLRIDVCLDTLPFNGGTTSLDALWMGVPVVTQAGGTAVGRAGLSLCHQLGMSEWVAKSDQEYIKIAVECAGDLGKLAGLRAALRPRMEQSPLMDGRRFARNMEAAYRQMWRAWCHARP